MSDATTLDLEFVRSQFPGLNEWALFENAGGTLVPRSVIDRVNAYMTDTQVQPGAEFASSALAEERISESQQAMAQMINASVDEIIISASTTMNIYVLSHALRPWFKPGDEVIVTNLDHEANNGAWRRLEEVGVVVKEWQMSSETAELEVGALENLLSERTRLVCFTHCSNITGSIHDVKNITNIVHQAGALVCVDAVAYAPHRHLDVQDLDVDFYACSLYKLYGPHLGMLYGKREHLSRARPQNHFFIEDIPLALNPGGPNHELTAALSGIVDYFDASHAHHFPGSNAELHQRFDQVFSLIAEHEQTLATRFMNFLNSKPGIRIIGRPTADKSLRVPTFSFVVGNRNSEEIPASLVRRKIGIRAGDFYARRCIDELGLQAQNGVIRASMVHYNTMDEVDRLIDGLDEII
ncbi:MAG: cysteine desulfurase-like protein [Gammaproteobacteria bacterium]|nr:cysteine desulfurase-like protein [Gammaproteobacteria bacterium]